MQPCRDDCEHRNTYREHFAFSILTKREQKNAMIASMTPDKCKRLQLLADRFVELHNEIGKVHDLCCLPGGLGRLLGRGGSTVGRAQEDRA